MIALDDALARLNQYNAGTYVVGTNQYGYSGVGGMDANWVQSLRDVALATTSIVTLAAATADDRVATAADRVATGQDRIATAADRVATGQDRTATAQARDDALAAVASVAGGPVVSVDEATGIVKLPSASTSVAGKVMLATGAEVLDGVVANKAVTPATLALRLLTVTPTGVVTQFVGLSAPSGWLLLDGRTIGDASSAATARASDDTQTLYTLIWTSLADAQAPVSGGRGASAAADWAAHKPITLPDLRGRAVIGSGTGSGLTARTHGAVGGEEAHTLSVTEIPAHSHPGSSVASAGAHAHTFPGPGGAGGSGALQNQTPAGDYSSSTAGDHGHGLTIASQGGGNPANIMQPWIALNYIIKM